MACMGNTNIIFALISILLLLLLPLNTTIYEILNFCHIYKLEIIRKTRVKRKYTFPIDSDKYIFSLSF